jgi:alpha-galactosidase
MTMKPLYAFLLIVHFSLQTQSQPFARWDENTLLLDNGLIRREIRLPAAGSGLYTTSILLRDNDLNFVSPNSAEFSFELDGEALHGRSAWVLVSIEKAADERQGDGAVVTLDHPSGRLRIAVTYLLYPQLPIVHKKIAFTGTGPGECRLESPDIESLSFRDSGLGSGTYCWVLHDYGRQKALGSYTGNWYDPLLLVHHVSQAWGFILGNETPGVMKRISAFARPDELAIGLTHKEQDFAFRRWLSPGETWESPWVFSGVYHNTQDPAAVLNGPVNDFVRRHMGIRLNDIAGKPTFVYNTWNPFRTFVNDSLVREVARAAAECGVQEFIIDDGWQINLGGHTSEKGWGQNYGDWAVDTVKFPGGLKPTFDYIRSLGMKPGLWISIGSATGDARVFREYPGWFVKNDRQRFGNLHSEEEGTGFYSSCMATDWFGYIRDVIVRLVDEYGLAYAKLDFAVVASAYVVNDARAGCHADNHPLHKDREESLLVIYERVMQLFDELHRAAPGLFIDCTFETAGKLQLMDYGIAKHAEGNWLSNFEEPAPAGALRVRQMAWWRSPVVPATSLVIGNQRLDDPQFELSLKSLAGSLPIVLGDPRTLTPDQRGRIRAYADWLKAMQAVHDIMTFRQDLPGFGEPAEGRWDGFQRINTESRSGGIAGVFRQGAAESRRTVCIGHLDPDVLYEVREAPGGKPLARMKGAELTRQGFEVRFEKEYDGRLFEIARIGK